MAQGEEAAVLEGVRPRAGESRTRALLARVAAATFDNPVLVKEFRTRMRGTRAYWMLLAYTLLLAGVLAIMYFLHQAAAVQDVDGGFRGGNTQATQDLGRQMFLFVFIAQSIMVALITPAITSGTITIEREQRSYELLVTTPLRPADLIRGKLAAAVSFVVLLLTASLPLVSLSFLVGGVSPAEIFFSYLIIALSAFVYGALGIFWSATLRSTAAATVVTYVTVLSLFILTVIPGWAGAASPGTGGSGGADIPFQSLNPLTATLRAVSPEAFFHIQVPSWIAGCVLNLLLGLLICTAAMDRLEHFEPPRSFWLRLWSSLLWCAFGLFLFGALLGHYARSWIGASPPVNENLATVVFLWALILLALVTPVLNTGDLIVRRGESALGRYLSGFLPHRIFGADLSCGFLLVLLWGAFLLALIPIGIRLTGKAALFHPTAVFVPGVILCLSVVAALAGIGNLLSVTLPSRWAACVLTYLAGVTTMVLPYFTYVGWNALQVRPRDPQLLWQLLYLLPERGLAQLGNLQFLSDQPALAFGPSVPIWVVTSSVYLLVAACCFLVTTVRVYQQGKMLQERMEAQEQALLGA